jgi:outer membrane murein-binding lipoprotein Lpp
VQRAAVVIVGVLLLAGCGPSTPHAQISKEAAIKAALAEIQSLERDHARLANQPLVTGFTVSRAYVTTQTASVTDSNGHVLTVSPAPAKAWVIEFTASAQGIWGSIFALQEVDTSTGATVGGGLWAVPINAAVKNG